MHDIELWHLLPAPDLDGDHPKDLKKSSLFSSIATKSFTDNASQETADSEVVDWNRLRERLSQLAARSPSERFPFLGRIEGMIVSEQVPADVRATAIRCFKAMSGLPAWKLVLECIDDPTSSVSDAAVETFLSFIPLGEWLQVHVLFHRNPAVREKALSYLLSERPEPQSNALLYLLSHSEHSPAIRQALAERLFHINIELADELCRRGVISTETMLRQLSRQERSSFLSGFNRGAKPSNETVSQLLRSFNDEDQASLDLHSYRDCMLTLLRYLWNRGPSDGDDVYQNLTRLLEEILHAGSTHSVRRRFLLACLILHRETGLWNEHLLGLCLRFYPTLLFARQLTPEVQKGIALTLNEPRALPILKTNPNVLRRLFQTAAAKRADSNLDLEYLGSLFHLASIDPYEMILAIYPLETIVQSFVSHIETSIPFFNHAHTSKARRKILAAVEQRRGDGSTSINALLILHIPAMAGSILEDLSIPNRCAILSELLQLSVSGKKRLNERHASNIVPLLMHGFREAEYETFFAKMISDIPWVRPTHLGKEILIYAANSLGADRFTSMVLEWSTESIQVLLRWIPFAAGFPYGCEFYLGALLIDHSDPDIREWASQRVNTQIATNSRIEAPAERSLEAEPIDNKLADRLALEDESKFELEARPWITRSVTGLCKLLSRRPLPTVPNVTVCAALLQCGDPLEEIDLWFDRYYGDLPGFAHELDRVLVDRALYGESGSLFLSAWLFRWEHHAFRFADQRLTDTAKILDCIEYTRSLTSTILRSHLWQAMHRVLMLWSYRDRNKFARFMDQRVLENLIMELSRPDAIWAARMLLRIWESNVDTTRMESVRGFCQQRLLSASHDVQVVLQPWIDTRGLPAGTERSSLLLLDVSGDSIAQIDSLDVLQEICRSKNENAASLAICRLLELGDSGCEALARLLVESPSLPHASLVAESVSYWPIELQTNLVPFVSDKRYSSMLRFLVGSQLVEAGFSELCAPVLEAVLEPTPIAWFQAQDVRRLLMLRFSMQELAEKLVESPHPQAYLWAIQTWKSIDANDEDVARRKSNALKRFLSFVPLRSHEARLEVAKELMACYDFFGVPLLLQHAAEEPEHDTTLIECPFLNEAIRCGELAGDSVFAESRVFEFFAQWRIAQPSDRLTAVSLRLLGSLRSSKIRDWVALSLRDTDAQSNKVQSVADTFAWGIHEGQKLTGSRFSIHVLGGDDMGYTRLTEKSIYINPLPILNGSRNGRAVVEGLVLHELGHHMYHAGEENLKVWEKASDDGIQELLNVVLDEHLERNLRALDIAYGDRLKKLGAYAFQHTRTDISVHHLLESLGIDDAFSILTKNRLAISRLDGCVKIDSGDILQAAERHGKSFLRFFRALRMGLGNRYNDPKVEQGLELFRGNFRHASMQQLDQIARRLQEIFGDETRCLKQFGFEVVLTDRDGQIGIDGLGLDDIQVQNEIVRITSKPSKKGRGSGGVRSINVGKDVSFERINRVERLHGDVEQYRKLCQSVARESRQFRRFLDGLGLRMVNQNRRLRGNRLDRPRLTNLVTTRDPRILRMRETRWETDLFLGIVIDCSGSMQHDDNIGKAKLFGTLLSEAARGLSTVDVRILGFTDSTIYDCGGSGSPGIDALVSDGGNNDAAGLWYASQLANQSKRKAKLLVMISDGLPTECSTEALRHLVKQLTTRSHMVCAQIAVRPLEEVCFENYVCLDTSNTSQCVRDFGKTLTGLVRQAMA